MRIQYLEQQINLYSKDIFLEMTTTIFTKRLQKVLIPEGEYAVNKVYKEEDLILSPALTSINKYDN